MGDLVSDSFDAAQFDVTLQLLGVCVPKADVADLSARLRRSGALFNMPRLRSVVECDSDDVRLVLLREDCGEGAHARPAQSRASHVLTRTRAQTCRASRRTPKPCSVRAAWRLNLTRLNSATTTGRRSTSCVCV